MKLINLINSCHSYPAQWEAETQAGDEVYIRLRCGYFKIEVAGVILLEKYFDDKTLGEMSTEEMLKLVDPLPDPVWGEDDSLVNDDEYNKFND